ncbi:WecB/TagA/CpsF family glycosyltransferase [Patescibacteria group bacterium]|nr:WecB/TagA/CpsF family glycosyltransferase [Patescibacteria group bacterium]
MKVNILGIPIDNLDDQEIESFIDDSKNKKCQMVVTVNPEIIMEAQTDRHYQKIIQQADLCIPDGMGIMMAAKYLGSPLKKRITGMDLIELVCQKAITNNQSIFLLGGLPGVSDQVVQKLIKLYPGIKISGFDSGFRFWGFRLPDLFLRNKINRSRADILLVAMGAPKQELWIAKNKDHLRSVKLAIGVGGAFDFISGNVKRAPKILQKVGLEWLWRLASQPWRGARIITAVWSFPMAVIKNKRRTT